MAWLPIQIQPSQRVIKCRATSEEDRNRLESRLESYWAALDPVPRVLSPWQTSRRFAELTYAREELVGSYKVRKYASLVPWMVERGFKRVRLMGSSHSSNIQRLALLLPQYAIEPSYVVEGREGPPVGNGLLSKLTLGSHYSSHPEPPDYDWIVPEGGSCPAALAGSLGIAGSVVQQALSLGHLPQDLYIDSGTGFTAAALLLGCGYFELNCEVHVVSMTGQTRAELDQTLDSLVPEYTRILKEPPRACDYTLHSPPIGRSFGSTPARVFEEVQAMAQLESVLVDPLYTAKLSLTYQELRNPERSALMFISGGVRDLLGFQGPLRKWLEAAGR